MRIVGEGIRIGMNVLKKKKNKEPVWKIRILSDIIKLGKYHSRIESWFGGRRKKKNKVKENVLLRSEVLVEKEKFFVGYGKAEIENNSKNHEIKHNRTQQFQDNKNLNTNRGRFFKNFKGKSEREKPLDGEEATKFWKGIWSISVEHKQDSELIGKTREKMTFEKQNILRITNDKVITKIKLVTNWTETGPDKIQWF